MRCQLSSLAANGWIAEEPERRDRTLAYKGALLQPLQFMFWSHLAHPDQWRHKSDRHRGLRLLIFSNNVTGSFTSASIPTGVQGPEGDKANGLTSLPNDATIWTEKAQLAWSHQFFLKRPWLMVRRGFELTTSRSADRPSSNWAYHWLCWLGLSPENSD